jgi:hypothetical protein
MITTRTRTTTPDLFSSTPTHAPSSSSENPPSSALVVAKAVNNLTSPRHILPKNLNRAVRHLSDGELDLLHAATTGEMERRGKLPPNLKTDPSSSHASDLLNKPPTHRPSVGSVDVGLTRGQTNAVRAAFKAGITPSRIARQFGISQANVRKALATERNETLSK